MLWLVVGVVPAMAVQSAAAESEHANDRKSQPFATVSCRVPDGSKSHGTAGRGSYGDVFLPGSPGWAAPSASGSASAASVTPGSTTSTTAPTVGSAGPGTNAGTPSANAGPTQPSASSPANPGTLTNPVERRAGGDPSASSSTPSAPTLNSSRGDDDRDRGWRRRHHGDGDGDGDDQGGNGNGRGRRQRGDGDGDDPGGAATPEPGTLMLLGTALAGIGLKRFRK